MVKKSIIENFDVLEDDGEKREIMEESYFLIFYQYIKMALVF